MPMNDINDFTRFIDIKESDDCLYWNGRLSYNGYGLFCYNRGIVRAHRYIYEYCVGEIPKGLDIDHLCRNRNCVNPLHMEPVTRRENLMRGNTLAKDNSLKTHCPKGHEYTPENIRAQSGGWRSCRLCSISLRREHRRVARLATDVLKVVQ